jgi:hypothetical protein
LRKKVEFGNRDWIGRIAGRCWSRCALGFSIGIIVGAHLRVRPRVATMRGHPAVSANRPNLNRGYQGKSKNRDYFWDVFRKALCAR